MRNAFRGITQQQSPLAVVISTLVIAALFTPLRGRIQHIIDRRFYRKKYNLMLALEEFATASQREVELRPLVQSMVGVTEKNLQPEQITVWLRKAKK